MRRLVPFALAALLFATACSSKGSPNATVVPTETAASPVSSVPAAAPSQPSASTATGPAEHDGARALQQLNNLAERIGPRVAGTAAEREAANYIASEFKTYGYDVEQMQFTFTGDRFRAGTVGIDGGKTYDAITMDGSAGGKVSGDAVFIGLADDAGIEGRSLAGKVAVADRGTLTFAQKYGNAQKAGAAALIILNNQPGSVNGRTQQDARIPVLAISGEDAGSVREAARAGRRFAVDAPASTGTNAVNVIARPSANAACSLLVGGHYDTVPSAPGANDNASGTANVIELARASAAGGLKPGLCFATWSAEESGLYGSGAFAQKLQPEGKLPRLYVNLDVTGIGKDVQIIGDSSFAKRAVDIAAANSIPAEHATLPANTGSDHMSFEQAGVPTIYLTSGDFATIHSPKDVTADIDEGELDRVGDLAFAIIQELLPQVARG